MRISPNSPRTKSIHAPHVLWPPRPQHFYLFADATPAAFKLVADNKDLNYLSDLVIANPQILNETILIARPFELVTQAAQAFANAKGKKAIQKVAEWLHGEIMRVRREQPRVGSLPIYWEALNEPHGRYADLAILDAHSAHLAKEDGIRRLLGGFSEGTPDIWDYPAPGEPPHDDWPDYYPALEAIHEVGHEVALGHSHEYVVDIDKVKDKTKERNELLSQPWRVGRINAVYRRHIYPNGLNVGWIISEAPLDNPLHCGVNNEMLLAWMTDPDYENLYVPQVKASAGYTMDACKEWQHFDLSGIAVPLYNDHVPNYKPSGDAPETPPIPSGQPLVTTIDRRGQWMRETPPIKGEVVGDMPFGGIGIIAPEDLARVGKTGEWIFVITTSYRGYMDASLLELKEETDV